MGATGLQVVCRVMIPESVPSLISNFTLAVTTVLGYSAMSGVIGGGGLGTIAYNYGYIRYKTLVMLFAVVFLVALVQVLQTAGNALAKKCDRRRRDGKWRA